MPSGRTNVNQQVDSLNDIKPLVEVASNGKDRGENENAEHSKRCDARGLLELSKDGFLKFEVVSDP